MTTPAEAIEAATRVIMTENACAKNNYDRCGTHTGSRWNLDKDTCRDVQGEAELALEAALPALEQQIREQVAAEILAMPNNYPAGPRNIYTRAQQDAAHIARGKDKS